jgi:hypothetical protein
MATDVGSITYTVETDTSSQLKAEKVIDQSTRRMESSFKKVDQTVKNFTRTLDKQVDAISALENELTSAGQKISKTGQVTNVYGQINKVATKKLLDLREEASELRNEISRTGRAALDAASKTKKLKEASEASARALNIQTEAAKRARARITNVSDATGKASNNVKNFSRNSGQAGIQFQQFIGQVQGGQSPMLAFSQQSADLGFVLGFPLLGAITGISASIAGIFLPALFNGETAVGRLQKVMESLRETAITTDDGITLLSSGIEKLAKKSRVAAGIEIELAMKKARSAIIDARKSINDAAAEWAGFGQGTSLLNQQFATAEGAAKRLGKTVKEIVTGAAIEQEGLVAGIFGIEEATKIREAIASTVKEFKISKESALDLLIAINDFKNSKITMEEFSEATLSVSRANSNVSDSFKKLLETSGDSTASASEATDILKVLELASKDLDKALTESSEGGFTKQKAAADALSDALDKMFTAEERLDEARGRREAAEKERLTKRVAGTGVTPLQALIIRQASEVEILKQGFEQKIIAEQEFLDRSAQLNIQHQEQVAALQKKTTEDSAVNWQALENQIVGTMASIVTGAQSGREAIQGLAQSILTQMVGALIKMGIQSIVSQTTTAAAGVATAATLATAYATPAALVSLASFGANAAPAAAGIASTVGLSNSLALGGSREHGGPVSAGKPFLVGERGKEIFTPNESGRITSNKDSFGGGGTTLNVSIENNTPSNVTTQMSDDGKQLKVFINEVANQISRNQGVIPRAMRQSTNTTFKAR